MARQRENPANNPVNNPVAQTDAGCVSDALGIMRNLSTLFSPNLDSKLGAQDMLRLIDTFYPDAPDILPPFLVPDAGNLQELKLPPGTEKPIMAGIYKARKDLKENLTYDENSARFIYTRNNREQIAGEFSIIRNADSIELHLSIVAPPYPSGMPSDGTVASVVWQQSPKGTNWKLIQVSADLADWRVHAVRTVKYGSDIATDTIIDARYPYKERIERHGRGDEVNNPNRNYTIRHNIKTGKILDSDET